MNKNILIIDDEKIQVAGLKRILSKKIGDSNIFGASDETEILQIIESKFYNLAIVDLRMDEYQYDGTDIIEKIIQYNPFCKIIIVSAYISEFIPKINNLLKTGQIIAVSEKKAIETWSDELAKIINDYFDHISETPSELNSVLMNYYSDAKNTTDTYIKGKKFEYFVIALLGFIGYKEIRTRVIDKSRNEVDLIVRNEIDDTFLNKFGKYILVECKNYPETGVGKNEFIQFFSKLENTNGLAQLGILFTAGHIAKTTYSEAMRTSTKSHKIIFISNPEIYRLINAENIKGELKKIIDEQVKDNSKSAL